MPLHVPKIICGACGVAVDLPTTPAARAEIRCPSCNQSDTLDSAVAQARRHATHMTQRAFEKKMQRAGRPLSRRTPSAIPERSLKWISNLEA